MEYKNFALNSDLKDINFIQNFNGNGTFKVRIGSLITIVRKDFTNFQGAIDANGDFVLLSGNIGQHVSVMCDSNFNLTVKNTEFTWIVIRIDY